MASYMATILANTEMRIGSPAPAKHRLMIVLSFLSTYLIWGSTYLAIRYAIETIPPLVTVAIRHSLAGGVLFVWAWKRGFRPTARNWAAGAVVGALFFLIGHGSLHWAEQYVTSGLAALLIATEPMWILLLGSFTGEEKINWMNSLGLLIGLAGVGILSAEGLSLHASNWIGMGAVLVGSLSWSLGVVLSPKLPMPQNSIGRAAVPLVCGAVMLHVAALVSGEYGRFHWAAVSLKSWFGLGYLVVFGSIVTFTAYTWLLEHCSPTLVATHTYANPVVAVILGWWLAGEPVSMRLVLSTGAILAAILLIQRGERVGQKVMPCAEVRGSSAA
jgi:drug/metabolite transporter (DMT)-like permease